MQEAKLLLFDCKPLNARMSRENCAATRKKSRELQFNNDGEGIPDLYGKCDGCSGVTGVGEEVIISAELPKGPRVTVPCIYGGFGYV